MRLIINSTKLTNVSENSVSLSIPPFICTNFYLLNANIPYTFYNVTSSNNFITVNSVNYTLTNQNYNAYDIASALTTLLTSLGITVTYNRQPLSFTFSSSPSYTYNFQSLGTILGFTNSTVYTGTSVTSIKCIDMTNNVRSLYIQSTVGNNNVIENNTILSSIIYRIPINCTFGNFITYTNQDISECLAIPYDSLISTINFTILDSSMNNISFNGVGWELEFYFQTTDHSFITRDDLDKLKIDLHPLQEIHKEEHKDEHPVSDPWLGDVSHLDYLPKLTIEEDEP